ncbi:UNVERIFIED_CONTAM: hypothetical protein Slati_3778300 [Sesamum latifolium]|uniref:Uncharacterized protein n=1 Tax=Sesamum latifolium TaxID=2727402 RepID=A0AAW2U863_9LAMI
MPTQEAEDEYRTQHFHNQTPSSSSPSQAQSYKQRLMNNSTHVYFPTWIREWEPSSNTEVDLGSYSIHMSMFNNGNHGRPIKTDSHTFSQSKGRYARLCIEVETTKPLPPALVIDNHVQQIKYELHMAFCSNYGAIGHLPATCSISQTETQGPVDSEGMNHSTPKHQWQFVQTKRKSTGNNRKSIDDDMAKSQGTTPSTFISPKGWSHKPNIKPNKKTFTQKWVRKMKESQMEAEKSSAVVPIMNTFSRLGDDLSVELVNADKDIHNPSSLYVQSENWIIILRHQV